MARSQTQKAIRKAERAGGRSFTHDRRTNEDYGVMSQHVRILPSKQEKLQRIKHKKRIGDDGASFCFILENVQFYTAAVI